MARLDIYLLIWYMLVPSKIPILYCHKKRYLFYMLEWVIYLPLLVAYTNKNPVSRYVWFLCVNYAGNKCNG